MYPSFPDTLGLEDSSDCEDVLISGVEDVLYQNIVNHLVPVVHVCVHTRGVSVVQVSGLEGSTVCA